MNKFEKDLFNILFVTLYFTPKKLDIEECATKLIDKSLWCKVDYYLLKWLDLGVVHRSNGKLVFHYSNMPFKYAVLAVNLIIRKRYAKWLK